MEDHHWQQSATQWQEAYQLVKKDRDKLLAKIEKIKALAEQCRRGCDCDYDFRCANCSRLIDLKAEIFDEVTK